MNPSSDPIARQNLRCQQRVAEFAELGVMASKFSNGVCGSITFSATEAEKLLKLIRRLKRQAAAKSRA